MYTAGEVHVLRLKALRAVTRESLRARVKASVAKFIIKITQSEALFIGLPPVVLSTHCNGAVLGLKYQRVESGVSRAAETEGGDPGRIW